MKLASFMSLERLNNPQVSEDDGDESRKSRVQVPEDIILKKYLSFLFILCRCAKSMDLYLPLRLPGSDRSRSRPKVRVQISTTHDVITRKATATGRSS